MRKNLPARPNLEHLRSQAKALLQRLRDGDPQAVATFAEHLPEARRLTPDQIREHGLRLADAQAAIARQTGFAAWPGLARHVDRLRSMEGTWAFRSLEIDGQAVPANFLGASHLLIDGDRFRMESPEAVYEGIFTIDVDTTPHTIDIDFYEGPEAGNRCEGLFELEGDRVRFCLGLAGTKRPKAFKTSPGSGHALEELERVVHGRPPKVDGGTPPPPKAEPEPASPAEAARFEGRMSPALERLQGEWVALEIVSSGKAVAPSHLPFGSRTHTGAHTKVVFGGQTMVDAQLRFDENASPIEVDYLNQNGTISLGLFRWTGDEAEFCVGAPGAARPGDFTSERGSGRTLSRWKRRLF